MTYLMRNYGLVTACVLLLTASAIAGSLNQPGGGGGGTNTNASTLCSGTTTYLDGEGNCDDIAAVYEDELTNSAGLLGALSDETGTGVAVFGTTPTIATPVLTLGTASSTASGRISYDAGNDRIVVGDGSATDDFYSGAHTSDTNANTVCSGSTTYLDGDGNCDNIGANTGDQTITLTGDVTGSGTGSFAATIQANSVALTTDTTGNYVATVAAGTGITIAEGDSEGSTKTVVSTLGTAIDSTEITDNTILEADLKAVDAPADEECLTYEATGGDFEWQACGGGGGGGEAAFTAESTPGVTPVATGTDDLAMGDGAVANGAAAIAIGELSDAGDASGDLGAIAIGSLAQALGPTSIAIGESASATHIDSIAIGHNATVSGNQGITVGGGSVTVANSIVVGYNSEATTGAIAIGIDTAAQGVSAIAIGQSVDATGANSIAIGGHITDGDSADATATNAIAIGVKTLASGVDSVAIGNRATATDVGQFAYASGYFAAVGDAQTSMYVLRNQTTNATQTELFTNGSSTGISVATDSTVFFRISIVARRTDVDNESAAYVIEGCIDNNAGTTALVGGLGTKTIVAEDTVAWDVTVTADNTNNEINILVTGESSKTIRWVATVVITTVSG